jgi:RNA polymerase sigma-70 factor (ECF subfamily)
MPITRDRPPADARALDLPPDGRLSSLRVARSHRPAHACAIPARSAADEAQALLAQGDLRSAIEALMEADGDAVYGYCLRVLRDQALAEDAFQQVFFEAHRDIETFRGGSSLRTWLLSIASHRCTDLTKSNRRRLQRIKADDHAISEFVDPASGPHDQLDQARLLAALDGCLEELSPEARATVLLRYKTGMSYDEMAVSLDAKADTLCTRVSRAMPTLKKCLERKGWTGE